MCIIGYGYVCRLATSPPTIMEAASGRLHNNGAGAFGARPIVVESIMVDGKEANIAIQLIPNESPSPMKATFLKIQV